MSEFTWGIFLVLLVGAISIGLGSSLTPVFLVLAAIGFLLAFRYPYAAFYLAIFFIPFLGFTLSIPTGELTIGERAFGGSIDIGIGEIILLVLLAAWASKIILLWYRRNDRNWRPRLPLLFSYLSLVAAHFFSAFSPLQPDAVLAAKFALRPVLFEYAAFIALPVNFIRSRRRLMATLGVLTVTGLIAACNGLLSLFFVGPASQFIRRAHPLPMFGVPALGDNHNLLAELFVVTVMTTLAFAVLVKKKNTKRLLTISAVFQLTIGLLTFSRTGWLVFLAQGIFLAFFEYRELLKRYIRHVIVACLILLPLALAMVRVASSNVATSSNSTRIALSEIAFDVFKTSPWIGGGAGTFVDRVGSSHVFTLEYGAPLDSHGFLQKVAAETGLLGLIAFGAVLVSYGWFMYRAYKKISHDAFKRAFLFLTSAAGGAVAYQLFNTNYWTGKMWFPIGLSLAAMHVFLSTDEQKDERTNELMNV